MKIGQFTSDITNSLKALNIDDYVSPRYLYYKAMTIAADFIKKDNQSNRRLALASEGWKPIECLEMEEIPITDCPELSTYLCERLYKSKYRIPDTLTTNFGNAIKYISSINYSNFYNPTTPRQWLAIQKRRDKDKSKRYYWIVDNYLYIPVAKYQVNDPSPEVIRMEGWFTEPWKADQANAKDCGCQDECFNVYDYELPIPAYLINDVTNQLFQQVRAIDLSITPDQYPNLSSADKTNQRDLQNERQ